MNTVTLHRRTKVVFTLVFGLLMLFVVSGCATTNGAGVGIAKGVSLEQRAVQRWEHIIAGRFAEAYEYYSPGAKASLDKDQYVMDMKLKPVSWKSALTFENHCKAGEESCEITLEVEFSVIIPGAGSENVSAPSFLTEQWLKIDGSWYFVPAEMLSGGLH